MDESVLSLVYFVLPLVISVFMLYLTVSQVQIKMMERREKELKILQDMIIRERHIYSEKALEIYKTEYAENEEVCKRMAGKKNKWDCHIVSRYDWMAKTEDGSFTPLKSVRINYNPNAWDTGNNLKMRLKYARGQNGVKLPYNKLSFTENVKALTGKYVMNELTYGLTAVKTEEGGGMCLDVCLGKYSDFFDTCGYMSYETVHRMHYGKKQYDLTLKDLPYRSRLDPFAVTNRFTTIRVCSLTILKNFENSDKVVFLMHRRLSPTAESGEEFNVIPAGSYKPVIIENVSDPDAEGTKRINIDPLNTVVREFLEQAVDKETYEKLSSKRMLLQKRKEIYADVFFLGVGLEPLNTRTELLTCMVVDVAMSPIFEGHKDIDGFTENIAKTFEGTVLVREFTIPNLEQYSDNLRSIPTSREILEFAIDRFDDLNDLKVSNNLNT